MGDERVKGRGTLLFEERSLQHDKYVCLRLNSITKMWRNSNAGKHIYRAKMWWNSNADKHIYRAEVTSLRKVKSLSSSLR